VLPKQTLALEQKAASVGGTLVFAAQIPSQGSMTRELPAAPSFQAALESQLVAATPVTTPATVTPPSSGPITSAGPSPAPSPAASGKTNLSLPIAVGLGAAALGFVLWRKKR
jgi:hypothetical protein